MSEYARVKRGGALKMKGGMKVKKKRKERSGEGRPRHAEAGAAGGGGAEEEEEEGDDEFKVSTGTGRLSSSGTAVMGHETKFMDELAVGDALVITHPSTLVDETRIVKMVLSNVSISISSPFSTDLVTTCTFRYISAPKVEESDDAKRAAEKRMKMTREDTAVGDYAGAGGTTLVYRKKKEGNVGGSNGYTIVTERLAEEKTRTELLEMRSKFKSDRHCA